MRLKIAISEQNLDDLLLQYLMEHAGEPSKLVTTVARMIGASSTELEAKDQSLQSEWHAIVSRKIAALARELHRDELEFFRKMGD